MSFIVSLRPPRHYFLHFVIFCFSNHVIYLCGKINIQNQDTNTKYKLERKHGLGVDLI